jgi:hypothetical protein
MSEVVTKLIEDGGLGVIISHDDTKCKTYFYGDKKQDCKGIHATALTALRRVAAASRFCFSTSVNQ